MVSPRRITRILLCLVLGLVLAGSAAVAGKHTACSHPLAAQVKKSLVRLFDLDQESNIPTWYSSFLLLSSAALLAFIGMRKKQAAAPYARHWLGLAAIFLYLSVDEEAVIHEMAITGKRLVSLPLTTCCHPLVPAAEIGNIARFVSKRFPHADHVLMKLPGRNPPAAEGESAPLFVQHILDIGTDLDALFRSFHSTSVRQRIRRAERDGMNLVPAQNERMLRSFFAIETDVRRKHGLPPPPYAFFRNMWRILGPENLWVPLVEFSGQIVAGAIILKSRHTFHLEYSACRADFMKTGANQKLIWETIRKAHQAGARRFDFGRSSLANPTLIEFKEAWGARSHPLDYRYYPDSKTPVAAAPAWMDLLIRVNRRLPRSILRLEGRLLYPHTG